jgi:hypothetical protein
VIAVSDHRARVVPSRAARRRVLSARGLALGDAAVEVGERLGLVFGANDGDGVDGVAGLAV